MPSGGATRTGAVCGLLAAMIVAGGVRAEPARNRTIRYDSDRKEWVEVAPPPVGTVEGDLHAVRTLLKEGRFRRARSNAEAAIKRYGPADAVHPDLLIAKAEALIGLREHAQAHAVLQEFLNAYAGSAATDEALRLEVIIAESFLSGVKRKVWGLRVFSGEDLAYEILDQISADHPDGRYGELAIKTKADHLFRTGEHALAEFEYDRLQREYPRGQYHSFAMARSAESALARFAGVPYDDAALVEASERFEEYRAAYPSAAQRDDVDLVLNGIQEWRAEKDYLTGRYYERTGHLHSAIFYYERVRDDAAATVAARKAAERLTILGATTNEPGAANEP